jgi:hypothetical protein
MGLEPLPTNAPLTAPSSGSVRRRGVFPFSEQRSSALRGRPLE